MNRVRPCLLAAVDLDRRAAGVIRRAARLAQSADLALVVVHVVEHETGFESDHVPFLSPAQLRGAMAQTAHERLQRLLQKLNLPQAECVVRAGALREELADLVQQRRARYVVTGPLKWGAISRLATLAADARLQEVGCDVLHAGDDDHWSMRLARWWSGVRASQP